MLQIEKRVTFLICFILLIAVFNVAITYVDCGEEGGYSQFFEYKCIRSIDLCIFLYEGWLIAFWGIVCGNCYWFDLCLVQQHFVCCVLIHLSLHCGSYPVV